MLLHTVPTRQGLHWAKLGLRTFWKQPLALSGLFFLFMALLSLASMLPLVGGLLALVLLPAFNTGMMAAAHHAHEGRFPMPSTLWLALRSGSQRKPMLQLGLLYAAGFLLVIAASVLLDGGTFARIYLLGESPSIAQTQSERFQVTLWLVMALYAPLAMMFWHAPALVYWQGVTPLKSLFFSWMACWRNKGAFVLYVLVWSAIFACAAIGAVLAAMLLGEPQLTLAILMPLGLLVTAMFFTSMLFSVQDCFSVRDSETPADSQAS